MIRDFNPYQWHSLSPGERKGKVWVGLEEVKLSKSLFWWSSLHCVRPNGLLDVLICPNDSSIRSIYHTFLIIHHLRAAISLLEASRKSHPSFPETWSINFSEKKRNPTRALVWWIGGLLSIGHAYDTYKLIALSLIQGIYAALFLGNISETCPPKKKVNGIDTRNLQCSIFFN